MFIYSNSMNFTFMIYILIATLIFISFDKNIKISNIYFLFGLLIILILNEIYNFNEYNAKEKFQSSDEDNNVDYSNYYFDASINPHKHYDHTYSGIEVPYDPILACKPQKKILEKNIQLKKLKLQESYPNKIFKIIQGNPVSLNKRDEDIFKRIPITQFQQDKNCPTLCHVIDDLQECHNKKHIPYFKEKHRLVNWLNKKKTCESLETEDACNESEDCSFDTFFNKCLSKENMKACTYKNVDNNLNCRTNCNYLNIPGDERVSKLKCENATYSDNTKYCNWDKEEKECKSIQ